MLSNAVGGVKIDVSEHEVAAARALLRQAASSASAQRTFRVARTLTFRYSFAGAVGGLLLGAMISIFTSLAFMLPVAALVGLVWGAIRGSKGESFCSAPGCGVDLTAEMSVCPGCGAKVAGVIAHPDDRLDAEERLRGEGS